MISLIYRIYRIKEMDKLNENRLTDAESKLVIARGERCWRAGWKR